MKIEIRNRLRPFSHAFGARCLLPGTEIAAKIYPAFIELEGIGQIELSLRGPVKGLTSLLDLEKGELVIFGHTADGYFRKQLSIKPGKICIGDAIFPARTAFPKQPMERVSFGCHKAQDWDAMRRRGSLVEWLPLWLIMAQWKGDITGIITSQTDRMSLGQVLMNLFEGSFEDYFVPAYERWKWLGLPQPGSHLCPLIYGAALLRNCLISFQTDTLHLLPCLPKELIVGRYLQASFSWGSVDFEWTKGLIRRMILKTTQDVCLTLSFQKEIASFRFQNLKDRMKNGEKIELKKGNSYTADRFEK